MDQPFEYLLAEQCAPVLARLKAASLFRIESADRAALLDTLLYWNGVLSPKGLCCRILKEYADGIHYLIYIYRPARLSGILRDPDSAAFLTKLGYTPSADCEGWLRQLTERLAACPGVVHEIGVFLGYPLRDVIGFIENRGEHYTARGMWKSYGDPVEAAAVFRKLKECTRVYQACYRRGIPIRLLAVAEG